MNKKNAVINGVTSKCVSRCYTSTFMGTKNWPKLNLMNKRGVSEIIATLLLMGITVAGAILISAFFSGNSLTQAQSSSATQTSSIKITGYDTRDGINLSDITGFDNKLDASPSPGPRLCTTSCDISPNSKPSSDGTDFIILTIRNTGPNPVHIQSIEVNNVEHTWDQNTKNIALAM